MNGDSRRDASRDATLAGYSSRQRQRIRQQREADGSHDGEMCCVVVASQL